MKFQRLVEIVGADPVFETGLLLAGDVDSNHVRRQISRWVRAGSVHQLRRGLYALAPPFLKAQPHPFHLANRLVRGSYVSLQSALAWHGLIPEHVPVTTSVTAQRPGRWDTPLGVYEYRHVKWAHLGGYTVVELAPGQPACVARPEQALLDLIHLQPGGDSTEHLVGLRLQNLDLLDLDRLSRFARRSGKPRLLRAARIVAELAAEQARELRAL